MEHQGIVAAGKKRNAGSTPEIVSSMGDRVLIQSVVFLLGVRMVAADSTNANRVSPLGQPTIQAIIAAWKDREAELGCVRCDWHGQLIWGRGCITAKGMPPVTRPDGTEVKNVVIPPSDRVTELTATLCWDWPCYRFEVSQEVFSNMASDFVRSRYVNIFDGRDTGEWKESPARKRPEAIIYPEDTGLGGALPVLLALHPLRINTIKEGLGNAKLRRIRQTGGPDALVELQIPIKGARGHVSYVLDPSRQYAVVQYLSSGDGVIAEAIHIDYDLHSGQWLPRRWRSTIRNAAGALVTSEDMRIVRLDTKLNPRDLNFVVRFPKGTMVEDLTGRGLRRYYVVGRPTIRLHHVLLALVLAVAASFICLYRRGTTRDSRRPLHSRRGISRE